jgi:hypothetical protein
VAESDGNGSGKLDSIESNLNQVSRRLNELTEKFHLMVDHHEAEFKQLMTWQVLTQDKMEKMTAMQAAEQKRLNTLTENTDKRIGELVGAISSLISRIPPESLK